MSTKLIRTILIDDELAATNALSKKLELYCQGIELIAKCDSAKDGLKAIIELKPDLVFLDIEMPWMNGFELLSCLGDELDFNVVFVTAYDQYAIRAFKVKAVDYLLKPVEKEDLVKCVERVKTEMKKFSKDSLGSLMDEMQKPRSMKRILIHSVDGIEVLESEEIAYCEAASNYTYVYTTDNRKIVVSKTLAEIEKSLDAKLFFRIHKSFTANLRFVQRYSSLDGGELVLRNGAKMPVSRRRKEEVLNAIANLI